MSILNMFKIKQVEKDGASGGPGRSTRTTPGQLRVAKDHGELDLQVGVC